MRFYDIRKGEGSRVLLIFGNIFLLIAALMVIKPVRNSLFLTRFGASQLPYAYILVALSAALVASVYAGLAGRFKLNRMIQLTSVFSLMCLLAFWTLFRSDYQPAFLRYLFYVWVAIFGIITTSQVWLLANYVFNAREARRLFPLVGAGAISGGIAGGYLTKLFAPVLGTTNLLMVAVSCLFFCILLQEIVWRKSARSSYREKMVRQKKLFVDATEESTIGLILGNRHLAYLATVIGIGVATANLVDYQFSAIVSKQIEGQDELTAFFGFWLSNLSLISLIVQFLFTGRILTSWGVGPSLFFLPLAILAGAVAVLFHPGIWSAILIKVGDGGFKYSIHKAGLELLILPVPAGIKNRVKGFIDVFVDSFAVGIGGLLLLLLTAVLGFDVREVAIITLVLIAVWLPMIVKVKSEYVQAFRAALEKRTIDPEIQTTSIQDASVFQSLLKVLQGNNERQILYSLNLLENTSRPELVPHLASLLDHLSSEVKTETLRLLKNYPDVSFEVEKLVLDDDVEVRISAIDYIVERSKNRYPDLHRFLDDADSRIQCAALITGGKLLSVDKEFRRRFDLEQVLDSMAEKLKDVSPAGALFFRKTEARVIGLSGIPELYSRLHRLLRDDSPEVRKAAIISAGVTEDRSLIPALIEQLTVKSVRKQAREALADYGETMLPLMAERFVDPLETRAVRANIPRIIALIDSQESADLLLSFLDEKDLVIRYEVLKSLNNLRSSFPGLKLNKAYIKLKVLEEARSYYRILTALYQESIQQDGKAEIRAARGLLVRALTERLDRNLERIFRLLGLSYKAEDMMSAYRGIRSLSGDLRANAVEFLDNVLDPGLKRQLLPIVEAPSIETLIRSYDNGNVPAERESLQYLLEGDDNWLKVCALYLVAELQERYFSEFVVKWQESSDPIVAETARLVIRKLEQEN